MADTLDVITLAEAKQALNIAPGASTYDPQLATLITAVSRRLDQLCGPIVQRSVTETFDGGSSSLLLRYRPVASITTLSDSGTALDAGAYTTNLAAGILRRYSGTSAQPFLTGVETVSVTYVAGRYADTASVQEPFRSAAGMLLAHMWRPEHGGSSETFGGAEDYPGGLPGYFLPNVVRGLLGDEIQTAVGIG